MLRVRPVLHTPAVAEVAELLADLGLPRVKDDGGRTVFNAGHGKLEVLHTGGEAWVELRFELRDAAVFVQRTLADGTHAELRGPDAVVRAPDGFTFTASPVEDPALPDPAALFAIEVIWRSPDPAAAAQVLANIGAKSDSGEHFRAKNGGFLATAEGEVNAAELCLPYRGDLRALAGPIGSAGTFTASGWRLALPGGGELTVRRWPAPGCA